MASTLASLCLSQRQTFWTYVVTVNLFPLYLMDFMFHTMLDAASIVLRGHYKSMKYFHKVAYVHYLGEVDIFSYMSKKISSSLQQCKNYKNWSRFTKVMITSVLPPFLWFTVYIRGRSAMCPACRSFIFYVLYMFLSISSAWLKTSSVKIFVSI